MRQLWRMRARLGSILGAAPRADNGTPLAFSDGSAARKRRQVAFFWASVIAVPASSSIIIVALSRHLVAGELAKVSIVFSLSFIAAVLPMAAQSQAAADVAGSGTVGRVHWRPIQITVVGLSIGAPVLATALGLPLFAVLLIVVMVLPSVAVGAARGELIARRSYREAAINHWIDAATRAVAGVTLGLLFGAAGVGASLLVAAAVSWIVLPILPEDPRRELRLPTALIASALLTLSIHLDVLLAPRLLGVGADEFAVAALPAKGVFMALMAAGWLVIPAAVGFRSVVDVLKPLALTVIGGVVLTGMAVAVTPILVIALARTPDRGLVLVLGLAMAAAAGNWVALQIRLARGSTTLWHPAVAAIAVIMIGGFTTRSSWGIAFSILAGQWIAFGITAWALMRETVARPAGAVPAVELADPVAAAASVADFVHADDPEPDPASDPAFEPAEPGTKPAIDTVGVPGGDRDAAPVNGERPLASFAVTGSVMAASGAPAPSGDSDSGAAPITARPDRALFSTTAASRLHARRQRAPKPEVDPHAIDGVVTAATRTPRRALAWLSVMLVGAAMLQHPGQVVHETKLDVSVDAMTFLGRIWHLWEPVADMGHVQNQAVGYLFPMGPFFVVGQLLNVPLWIIQRGWMGLLLVLAFWGMTRLADQFEIGTPTTRTIGALAYALSPFFISRVGTTSAFVLGGVMLPWIMIPLVRASRAGSIRRGAALSGLAVFAIGGINGAVTLAVLITPLLFLLTRQRGRRRNQLLMWWLVAVALATAWWIIPLWFQLRYGFNFMPFTERAATTTAYTSTPEVLRGTGDWLSYLHLREGWLPAGWSLVADPLAIIGSVAIAALGLYGLARRDLQQRSVLLLSFLGGVAIVGAGYGGLFGNPVAGIVRALLDGPGGLFRNIYKFQPLIALPLAFGVIHSLTVIGAWVAERSGAEVFTLKWWPNRAIPRRVFAATPFVIIGVILVAALPLSAGNLVSDKGFAAIPSWWNEVEQTQKDLVAPGRALILPGAPAGDFTWGRTLDEPLQTTTDTPWALRSLIPLGGPGSTRVMDAVELAIERGGDAGLIPFLQRTGINYVVARNDLKWKDWNAPRPLQVHRALLASGLTRIRSFGPNLPLDRDPADPGFAVDGAEHELRAIELYQVGTATMVQTYPAATASVLSGGPEAELALARNGMGDRALILPGDLPAGRPLPDTWIVSDTLRRRYVEFGLMRSNFSYTLTPDENSPDGKPLATQLLPNEGAQHQTVARLTGVKAITASSYGSWLYQIPETSPSNALDGDPNTVWVAGATHSSSGEWWRTDFDNPLNLDTIEVQLLEEGTWRPEVRSLKVTTEKGSIITDVAPNESRQSVKVPPGTTAWLKISFESITGETARSAGAGIREVAIPGVIAHRELVTPSEMKDQFTPANQNAPIFTFERSTSDPRSLLRRDEEVRLNRVFTVPHQADFAVTATASPVPGDKLFELLRSDIDQRLRVTASSTLSGLPEYDPRHLVDERDDTIWAAQPPDALPLNPPAAPGRDTNPGGADARTNQVAPAPQQIDSKPTLRMAWDAPRQLDSVVVTDAPGFSRPRSIKIVSPDGERDGPVGADGVARFAALTTTSLEITFPEIDARSTRNPLDRSLTTLPVGLAGLRFPALADLAGGRRDLTRPIRVSCADGPMLTIDGVVHRFSVDTTSPALTSLQPLPVKDCGSDLDPASGSRSVALPADGATANGSATSTVRLSAGEHRVTGGAGSSPFLLTTLMLRDPSAINARLPGPGDSNPSARNDSGNTVATGSGAPGITDTRVARMLDWGKEDRRISIDAGPTSYLTIDENFSNGWDARLNGEPLEPIRLDGWRQAFIVPSGRGGEVSLHFQPADTYRAGLVVGALLVLLLLALALIPDRRRVRPGRVDEAMIPWWLWMSISLVSGLWIAGAAAVLLIPLWIVARRWPALIAPIAAISMALSGVIVLTGSGRGPSDHTGTFGWVAQLIAGTAILAVASSTSTGPRAGWRAWWAQHAVEAVEPPPLAERVGAVRRARDRAWRPAAGTRRVPSWSDLGSPGPTVDPPPERTQPGEREPVTIDLRRAQRLHGDEVGPALGREGEVENERDDEFGIDRSDTPGPGGRTYERQRAAGAPARHARTTVARVVPRVRKPAPETTGQSASPRDPSADRDPDDRAPDESTDDGSGPRAR